MKLIDYSLKNRKVIILLILITLLSGFFAYKTLPRAMDPGFAIRTAVITTYYPGANAKEVSELITSKIEKEVQNLEGLDYTNSISKDGESVVYVNIKNDYVDKLQEVWSKLRRRISFLEKTKALPNGIIGPVINDNFGDVYGSVFAITGDGYTYKELKNIAEDIKIKLGLLDQVGKIDIRGEQDQQLYVQFNYSKLAKMHLSPYLIAKILKEQNIIIPSGEVYKGKNRMVVDTTGNLDSVKQLKNMLIGVPGLGNPIYLKDIATITMKYQTPPRNKIMFNGKPAISLAVSLMNNGNIITLGQQLNSFFKTYALPAGVKINVIKFQPNDVKQKVSLFLRNLIEAILILSISVILFLGVRTGLIVAAVIPLTIMATFGLMPLFHIQIDQISLAALMIALGILVDNGIVLVEATFVKMEEGVERVTAALQTAKELAFPLFISSSCLSGAFLPIFLSKTETGQYCQELFKVVAITLFSSWFFAMTVMPLFCIWFIKLKKDQHLKSNDDLYNTKFYNFYKRLLLKLLRAKYFTLIVVVIIFFAVMSLFKYIPQIFFPASSLKIITMNIDLPEDASIYSTISAVNKVNKYIKNNLLVNKTRKDGIENWSSYVGSTPPRFLLQYSPDPDYQNNAVLVINVNEVENIGMVMQKLTKFAKTNILDGQVRVQKIKLGIPVKYPVEVRVSGKNIDALETISRSIRNKLSTLNGTTNISDDWGLKTKKIEIEVNQEKARDLGISSTEISLSLQSMLNGLPVSIYRENGEMIPLLLKGEDSNNVIQKIKTATIYSMSKKLYVPLMQIATLKLKWDHPVIQRRKRDNTITIRCDVISPITALSINQKIKPWLNKQEESWANGYFWSFGGANEASGKANNGIMKNVPLTILLLFALLVIKFNSFKKTFTLFAILPLGLIGVTLGLLLLNSVFGFMTLLGVISLFGIMLNHAIVLVDRIGIEYQENGGNHHKAVVMATIRRSRPVLITGITAVLGLLPLYFEGGAMWQPLAVAIMCGVVIEMPLILLVVPVIYSILSRLDFRK